MKPTCVYLITVGNGLQYIGVAINLERRLREHKARDACIGRALRKHGMKSVEVLHLCESFEAALALEKIEVDQRQTLSPNGYNMTKGGYGSSGHPTPEHVLRIRSERMRKTNSETSPEQREINWRKGLEKAASIPWSEERHRKHKEKMIARHAKNKELGLPSPTAKAVAKAAQCWTDERRAKIGASKLGKPWTEERKAARREQIRLKNQSIQDEKS